MTDVPTPAQAEKAAMFFDILHEAREAGKGWWSSSQMRQIEVAIEQDKKIAALIKALGAASNALRSYQYGNSATDLAQSTADFCDAAIQSARTAP